MEKILDKNLTMIDQLAAVREAGEDMKSTLDEQIDKFEDENNFLNIDPEAEKISFTSSKIRPRTACRSSCGPMRSAMMMNQPISPIRRQTAAVKKVR